MPKPATSRLDDVEDLTGLSVNELGRYMPRKLAEKVFELLHSTEQAEGNHTANGKRISWDVSDKLQDEANAQSGGFDEFKTILNSS